MGGPAKFKAAMKNRPVEIVRVKTLPPGFEDHTGLALPYIPIHFMVNGLMLPDSPFDIGERRATYTAIHELGHVWDIRSALSFQLIWRCISETQSMEMISSSLAFRILQIRYFASLVQ
jgi:hypothetical protein